MENGPIMLVATTVLRGHKARIGKIGGNITLPRTIPLANLLAGGAGGLVGLLLVAIVNTNISSLIYGIMFGAGTGVFLLTWSPLQGESMLKWMGLNLASKRQEIKIDGKPVRLAIGVAYLSTSAKGSVRVVKGAVNVPPSQYDERGVPLNSKNMNMPDTLDGIILPKRSRDFKDDGVALPKNSGTSLESKKGKKEAARAAGLTGKNQLSQEFGKESVRQEENSATRRGRLVAARAAQLGPAPQEWVGKKETPQIPEPRTLPFGKKREDSAGVEQAFQENSFNGNQPYAEVGATQEAKKEAVEMFDPFSQPAKKLPKQKSPK